jgi:uncharacterized membrane protein YphA (DoxX/SURF4 family)
MSDFFNVQLAVFVLRSVTGLLFLTQGYDRAFKVKADEIVSAFQTDVIRKVLPGSLMKFTVHISAYIELIGGIMLLVGFQRDIALYILSAEMIFVTLAFSLIQPMWDMQYFFPRFAFIITLLLLPAEWDRFSIDHVLKSHL